MEACLAAGARSLLILAADGNGCRPEHFDPWLRSLPVPVLGGVFPQLIHGPVNADQGYLVLALDRPLAIHAVGGLSDPDADFSLAVEEAWGKAAAPPAMLVLVDGLASQVGAFLEGVYDILGGDVAYFGGGAGSLSFRQAPCLFSNQGMLEDHALLAALPWPMALGVEHGWEKLAGPFMVTGAQRNVVASLDYTPAGAIYRCHVEASSGQTFSDGNFFAIAKGYPLGMERADGSLVVRDPITLQGEELVCVGEVPANSVVHLLKGSPERLIAAARAAAGRVGPGEGGKRGPALLIDCISRVLFLQERFHEELEAVQEALGERPLFGMLTLGEIANGGDYCLEFYNKTLVLAAAR